MKKLVIVASLVIAVAVAIVLVLFIRDRQKYKPGNIFKSTFAECDRVGYGYKGMCYGNLAVQKKDKSICDRIAESESFNREKCADYYNENKR